MVARASPEIQTEYVTVPNKAGKEHAYAVIALDLGIYLVSSRTVCGGWHRVVGSTCDCEAHHWRGDCAHVQAVGRRNHLRRQSE